MTHMLFEQITALGADRALGARLSALTTAHTRLWGHWGMAEGPSAIEMAALPVSLAIEGLTPVGEDMLWAGQHAKVAAGRWMLTGRHSRDGVWGPASGAAIRARAMAELYLIEDRVVEGIVILDTATVLANIGGDLAGWARARADHVSAMLPEPPQSLPPNDWADAWAGMITRGMSDGFGTVGAQFAEGCTVDWPGASTVHGPRAAETLWSGLREALPGAKLTLVHRLGRVDPLMPPRASVRWRLTGRHDGWGRFGAPTGADITVTGISQAEFGPDGVRREVTVFDEAAIWAQIFAATGAHDG
ncbi:MAG: nuclear transport factor 2 family protein [Paracoccaceae bacterium]